MKKVLRNKNHIQIQVPRISDDLSRQEMRIKPGDVACREIVHENQQWQYLALARFSTGSHVSSELW